MSKKTMEQRIRKLARAKIKVSITKKRRNRAGFDVVYPMSDGNETAIGARFIRTHTKSHKQAVVTVLTAMRCFNEFEFSIKPTKKGRP